MKGLIVFPSLRAALDAGFHIYGKTERGYLARLRTDAGWALALVECAGTSSGMERQPKEDEPLKPPPDKPANKGEEDLDDYDKTMADSFPASDPPAQP